MEMWIACNLSANSSLLLLGETVKETKVSQKENLNQVEEKTSVWIDLF